MLRRDLHERKVEALISERWECPKSTDPSWAQFSKAELLISANMEPKLIAVMFVPEKAPDPTALSSRQLISVKPEPRNASASITDTVLGRKIVLRFPQPKKPRAPIDSIPCGNIQDDNCVQLAKVSLSTTMIAFPSETLTKSRHPAHAFAGIDVTSGPTNNLYTV
jgi:hypothetical protein